jgi:uncharacterized protein YodC (DUF2158 family)
MKKFTIEEISDLLNQVMREEISFSEMVEVINQMVSDAEKHTFKEGDFLHSDWDDENITIIFKNQEGDKIYYHASKSCYFDVTVNDNRFWRNEGDFRHATEEEKKELLDALAKEGKRWSAEKKCIEDIPVRKFKKGDKVRIKEGISSKTHNNVAPSFVEEMDDLIGKTMTVDRYTYTSYVKCEGVNWSFHEDWLEPYVEDIPKHKFKKGDKVILKSGYKKLDSLIYLDVFDLLIGKPLTIKGYTEAGNVYFSDCEYIFAEDWLEPYEELKKGDLAIFWDNGVQHYATVRIYGGLLMCGHCDMGNVHWDNAIKFESKEQYERLIKGEI